MSENFNQDVLQWSQESVAMMKQRVSQLTNKSKHEYLKAKGASLEQSIKTRNTKRFGDIERIMFPFLRHGFFIAIGASRKHPYKSNPRQKIEWYNFIFDKRIDTLADIVAEHYADKAMAKASDLGVK
jgi:hypothetical protein